MKYLSIFAAIIIVLTACSKQNERNASAYNEAFNGKNFVEIAEKIKNEKAFPTQDADLLAMGLKRLSFNKDSISGKTVKQIIELEETYEHDMKMKGLKQLSEVSLLRFNSKTKYLGVLPNKNEAGEDINQLFFVFENNLDKGIKSVGGEVLLFYNEPGQESKQLKPFPFNYNAKIAASKTDTIMMMQIYKDTDEMSKFIRTNTAQMSGLLNITNVEFE